MREGRRYSPSPLIAHELCFYLFLFPSQLVSGAACHLVLVWFASLQMLVLIFLPLLVQPRIRKSKFKLSSTARFGHCVVTMFVTFSCGDEETTGLHRGKRTGMSCNWEKAQKIRQCFERVIPDAPDGLICAV